MTHTSTSPNYQILASLDVGRRQVELEGYELVTQDGRARDDAAPADRRSSRCYASTSACFSVAGHDPGGVPPVRA